MTDEIKHLYAFQLTKNTINKIRDIIKPYGGKLTPMIDKILTEWVQRYDNKKNKSEDDKS
jgi:hypothetical protein